MIAYATIATILALTAARLYVGQVRKTRAAVERANTAEADATDHYNTAVGLRYKLTAAESKAEKAQRSADHWEKSWGEEVRVAVAALEDVVDLRSRSLPAAPFRTADPTIPAKPWSYEPVVLNMPPLLDDTGTKRNAAKR